MFEAGLSDFLQVRLEAGLEENSQAPCLAMFGNVHFPVLAAYAPQRPLILTSVHVRPTFTR